MSLSKLFFSKKDQDSAVSVAESVLAPSTYINEEYSGGLSEFSSNIADIYAYMGLGDEASIFKVQELVNKLPREMPKDDVKKTIIGICSVTGLDISNLITEGNLRKSSILNYTSTFSTQSTTEISQLQEEISTLENTIEQNKARIKYLRSLGAEIIKSVETETSLITDLISYVE